jgi:hypothetical protein
MKKCMICGRIEDDSAPTCPDCGEASWELMPEPEPEPERKPEPAKRRGK